MDNNELIEKKKKIYICCFRKRLDRIKKEGFIYL